MKLYTTVISERASKGQGGNDYIKIELYGSDKKLLATLHYNYNSSKGYTLELEKDGRKLLALF